MNKTWNDSVRNSLKSANQCNVYFGHKRFHEANFPIKVPLEFAERIDKSNPLDPLLLQILPKETETIKGFLDSPVLDEQYSPVKGLIHKYPSRVLLISSSVCAIHCQYCFRQNFDYESHDILKNWDDIESYLSKNKEVNEVILSGGDPLTLSDKKISKILKKIESISHIKTLRIHTRTAVVIPSRITQELIEILNITKLKVVIVFHINHAQEISDEFVKNIQALRGLTLLNQSVLLKDVNDNAKVLADLSYKLFESSILPYYLHLLDKVSGAERFLISDKKAKEIYKLLQKSIPGYLLPRMVRDEGGESKNLVL
jgi:EF-P beta-lysylation protein EpmB